ncbi:unnamed protein product [Coccothraustes coccothraustes]
MRPGAAPVCGPRSIGSGADPTSPLASFIPFFTASRTETAPSPPHRPKSRCSVSPSSIGRQTELWGKPFLWR